MSRAARGGGEGDRIAVGVGAAPGIYVQREAAALFYEGVDERTRGTTRAAEHLAAADGKIAKIITAICPLDRT